jgi:hypothetical protein
MIASNYDCKHPDYDGKYCYFQSFRICEAHKLEFNGDLDELKYEFVDVPIKQLESVKDYLIAIPKTYLKNLQVEGPDWN